MERLEGGKDLMSEIKKSRRVALSWDQEYKPNLEDLKYWLDKNSEKNKVNNLDIFMLCLSVGLESKEKRDVPPKKSDAVRLAYLKESDFALMKTIALFDSKDPLVLLDEDKIFDIVEQYAAAGLKVLTLEMKTQNDFPSWLRQKLFKKAQSFATLKK
jgi:hypothetical protein